MLLRSNFHCGSSSWSIIYYPLRKKIDNVRYWSFDNDFNNEVNKAYNHKSFTYSTLFLSKADNLFSSKPFTSNNSDLLALLAFIPTTYNRILICLNPNIDYDEETNNNCQLNIMIMFIIIIVARHEEYI